MQEISDEEARELVGGGCGFSIVVATSIGGLFGGIGAAIGFLGAVAGPACLNL